METVIQDVQEYVTTEGKNPLREWLLGLRDESVVIAVKKRIDRLYFGNLGDHKALGGGLFELRVHYGAGYRIYFGRKGMQIVILLCGGDKRTQLWDIQKAKIYWKDYLGRKK